MKMRAANAVPTNMPIQNGERRRCTGVTLAVSVIAGYAPQLGALRAGVREAAPCPQRIVMADAHRWMRPGFVRHRTVSVVCRIRSAGPDSLAISMTRLAGNDD